jgi:hypothetical protein
MDLYLNQHQFMFFKHQTSYFKQISQPRLCNKQLDWIQDCLRQLIFETLHPQPAVMYDNFSLKLHNFIVFLPSVVNNKRSKKMISVQNQPLQTVTISISITFHNGTRANYHDKYTCNVIWQTAHAHCVLLLLVHTYALLVRII